MTVVVDVACDHAGAALRHIRIPRHATAKTLYVHRLLLRGGILDRMVNSLVARAGIVHPNGVYSSIRMYELYASPKAQSRRIRLDSLKV